MNDESENRTTAVDTNDGSPLVPAGVTDPSFQLAMVTAFIIISLIAPPFVGEVYPFTNSPLFRDQPELYTLYAVYDEEGRKLPPENYGVQLNYDGNPPGLGVGIVPPETVNLFGMVADEADVRRQVQDHLNKSTRKVVIVEQRVYGAFDDQRVGQIEGRTRRWRIESNLRRLPATAHEQ